MAQVNDPLTARMSVVDGTTLQIPDRGLTVKLYGVATCAFNQRAFYRGIAWPCGAVAASWLTRQTLGLQLQCLKEGDAGYASFYARCFLPDGTDLAKKALSEGVMIAARKDGRIIVPEYASLEGLARKQNKGLWSSNFEIGGMLFSYIAMPH